MSLVRLLSSGKSLVGGATKDTSRYRMGNPGMLPKFGSVGKTVPSGRKEPAPVVCESETMDQSSQPQESLDVRAASPRKEKVSFRAIYRSFLGRIKARMSRIYVKPARPAAPRSAKPAVQTELSLDKVRVVRNDLSETDLEIVPGKSAPDRSNSALTRVAPEIAPGPFSERQPGEQVVNR